jgi:glucokinase
VPPDRVIGVDVGGTKIRAGMLGRDGSAGPVIEVPSPTDSADSFLSELDRVIESLLPEEPAAIGVGVPMTIDRVTGIALRANNLPLFEIDFTHRLRERFGLPIGLENDGNATALAEWRLGAGRGAHDLVAIALGTGVGGGLVLDGRLYRGWAELGHIVVEADGPPCQGNCDGRGHLEALASGEAAESAAEAIWGERDAHRLVEAARAGDSRARAKIDRIGHYVGIAIGSLTNIFVPEVVVMGGGFGAAAWDVLREPALAAARREALGPADERLQVVPAVLGDEAGLVGAGLVCFEALDGAR